MGARLQLLRPSLIRPSKVEVIIGARDLETSNCTVLHCVSQAASVWGSDIAEAVCGWVMWYSCTLYSLFPVL